MDLFHLLDMTILKIERKFGLYLSLKLVLTHSHTAHINYVRVGKTT